MNPRPESDIRVEACGWFRCSAADNLVAYSKDGTLFHAYTEGVRRQTAPPGAYLPPNLNRADRDTCGLVIPSMNAIK